MPAALAAHALQKLHECSLITLKQHHSGSGQDVSNNYGGLIAIVALGALTLIFALQSLQEIDR